VILGGFIIKGKNRATPQRGGITSPGAEKQAKGLTYMLSALRNSRKDADMGKRSGYAKRQEKLNGSVC